MSSSAGPFPHTDSEGQFIFHVSPLVVSPLIEFKNDESPNRINGEDKCFHPKNCLPEYRDWIRTPSGEAISSSLIDKVQIITSMHTIVSKEYFMNTLTELEKRLY